MARLSRLLSAVCLGIAATAAVSAVVATVEHNPVHRNPQPVDASGRARVIVKFKSNASVLSSTKSVQSASAGTRSGVHAAGLMQGRLGVSLADGRALDERTQVLTSDSVSSSALVDALSADADVEWAVVDQRRYVQLAVDDPRYPDNRTSDVAPTGPSSGQWYLRAPGIDASGRNVVSGINIEPAWAITHGSPAIVIGDVDTGITAHPDLDSKIFPATFPGTTSSTPYGYDFVGWGVTHNIENLGTEDSSDALASANDGSLADADPSDPGDWVTAAEDVSLCNDSSPGTAQSSTWHGTQTASILAAATNNGVGMASVGYDTMVVPARALGKCGGYDSDIIAATEWAGGIAVAGVPTNIHPAKVVNMSLGGDGACSAAYVDALTQLRNRGVIVVAAAGNGNSDNLGIAVSTPANCKPASTDTNKTPIVIAVAALRHAGTKVGFSNLGNEVTIAAPGGNCVNVAAGSQCLYPIVTAINSGSTTPVANGGTYSDGLNNVSLGTSFSTPMVAGTVALMFAAQPELTNQQVIDILKSTSRRFPTVSDTTPTPAVCSVPTANGAGQGECLCTTSTCGAGMLDAGAAVTLASTTSPSATAPTAVVSPTASSVAVGSTVTLSGAGSGLGSSGAALTFQWTIPDADTHITLGNATGSSVVVAGATAGTGQVQLTVFDSTTGLSNSATVSVTVTAAPASTGGGGGGGGGAANPAWLAALALAGLLLGSRARRKRA